MQDTLLTHELSLQGPRVRPRATVAAAFSTRTGAEAAQIEWDLRCSLPLTAGVLLMSLLALHLELPCPLLITSNFVASPVNSPACTASHCFCACLASDDEQPGWQSSQLGCPDRMSESWTYLRREHSTTHDGVPHIVGRIILEGTNVTAW